MHGPEISDLNLPAETLAEVLKAGFLLVTPEMELDFISSEAKKVLGYDRDEISWATLQGYIEQALETCGEPEVEKIPEMMFEVGRPPRRLSVQIHLLKEKCEGYLVTIQDLDKLEALDFDLQLAARFRTVAALYQSMAHDIRAPLSAMQIAIAVLEKRFNGKGEGAAKNSDDGQLYLNALRDETSRLDRLLKTFLDQATAPRKVEISLFDLREVIDEVCALLEIQVRSTEVEFSATHSSETIWVRGSKDQLKQALLNVVLNGLEAVDAAGRVKVETQVEEDTVRISVIDNGPGIPPEILQKIWGMHFTTKKSGTGIGLYVARNIIECHQGSISVRSIPHEGTRFDLRLPRVHPDPPPGKRG